MRWEFVAVGAWAGLPIQRKPGIKLASKGWVALTLVAVWAILLLPEVLLIVRSYHPLAILHVVLMVRISNFSTAGNAIPMRPLLSTHSHLNSLAF